MTGKECVLGAKESKQRYCCYMDCFFNCTAPLHQYEYCVWFLKRIHGGF